MQDGDILILKGREVLSLLDGQELRLLDAVEEAYKIHATGDTSLPHSVFLRFPDEERNRIIGLPAYLGARFNLAGIKWISSFPRNLESGLDRASATIIVNSTVTGRPEAILEASTISARRTAASAALAAKYLQGDEKSRCAGIVGCGLINFETAKLLLLTCPEITTFYVFDIDPARARQFGEKLLKLGLNFELIMAPDLETVLANCLLVSVATTAVKPHIFDLSACKPGAVVLHISLRDLSEQVILASDNVVDDISHVCRAETSVHLAERLTGHRDFIRCTLAEVLSNTAPPKTAVERPTVFSPFGLGILDLAVTRLVLELAASEKLGTVIDSFLPDSWTEAGDYISVSNRS
jgi:N-[(2S)-2-amino-2-carboxyethyl]-L-glutamate dehydrogenase